VIAQSLLDLTLDHLGESGEHPTKCDFDFLPDLKDGDS